MTEKRAFKRISVVLDKKTFEALNTLVQRKHLKISDVVRLSIMHYFQQVENKSNSDKLRKIAHYLSDGSHLIVDIETLISLLRGRFTAEKDGFKLGEYYKSIGINDFLEILRQLEIKNWFKLRLESENCYLLTLPDPKLQKYVKQFLKGLSDFLDIKIKIKEIGERILVITL